MKKRRQQNKWFEAGKSLGWRKDDTQAKRRRAALKSRQGDLLATARALMALSNVTQDHETSRKAKADAHYFYALYKKKNKRGRR